MAKFEVKGIDELIRKLDNANKKLKKYDGSHDIVLPFSKKEWNNMSQSERDMHIQEASNKFVNNMIKDVFK